MRFAPLSSVYSDSITLLLDIQSDSVGVGIARFKRHTPPTLLWNTRVQAPLRSELDIERILPSTLEMLQSGLSLAESAVRTGSVQGLSRVRDIESVACIFSSPWNLSHIKTIVFERKGPFSVTESLVQKMLLRGADESFEAKRLRKESGLFHNIARIEEKIVEMKLNGYATANPFGMEAERLELFLYEGFASKEVMQAVAERVLSVFAGRSLSFHTSPLVSFLSLREVYPSSEPSSLIIAALGEVTDVSLIRGGALLEVMSFPNGRNKMLRNLLRKGKSGAEAATLARESTRGNLELLPEVEEHMRDAKNSWLREFEKEVGPALSSFFLPERLFLLSYPDALPHFSNALREYAEERANNSFVEIMTVTPEHLNGKISWGKSPSSPDAFILLGTIHLNHIREKATLFLSLSTKAPSESTFAL